MDVLLVAPYFGGSHRAWAEGYARHSRHHVDLLTLPARFWMWRMQGGAVTLVEKLRRRDLHPDVVLATDMVNLPALLGLARNRLAGVPVALYCHENQLTYPLQAGKKRDLTYPMINWLSMVAADQVFFNSAFHQRAWFRSLPKLLKHFPDASHLPLVPAVEAKVEVLPVGCELRALDAARYNAPRYDAPCYDTAPLILWNQRWEYDKDPATFFRALEALVTEGVAFRVALAGSNVRQQPEEFEAARKRLGARVVHFGRADRATYRRLLWEADVVVSTAIHEFFGIAVVEAVYCGCFPVLPRRLAYPELLPGRYHATCIYDGFDDLVARLRWALTHPVEARDAAQGLDAAVARFDWQVMAPQYDASLSLVRR